MAKRNVQSNHSDSRRPAPQRPRVGGRVAAILLVSATLMVFLAMLSFHPADIVYLEHGVEGPTVWRNWIGFYGALGARTLLLLFGLAAYPTVMLCLLSFVRRVWPGASARAAGWEYWLAFLLVLVGVSMLFGTWPGTLPGLTEYLNLTATAGGAVGNYLCAPDGGKLGIVLNQTGSALVSATLVIVGLVVVWLYDWHDALIAWQTRMHERRRRQQEEEIDGSAKRPAAAAANKAGGSGRYRLSEDERARILRAQEKGAADKTQTAADTEAGRSEKNNEEERRRSRTTKPAPPSKPSGKSAPARKGPDYELPALSLLDACDDSIETMVRPEEVEKKKIILQATLDSFNIDAKVGQATSGPRVTLFEVEPAPGVKVERISNLSNNIAMELQAQSLRILTPIPGRKSVGIEVPNDRAAIVSLQGLMNTPVWRNKKASIPLLLGRNISGKPVLLDLAKAPHLLIAGATGSGKSVCINALIMSLLYRFSPEEMRLVLVDPKVVEFSCYKRLPHLVVPVITDSNKVVLALRWVINEMERRYSMFAAVNARNIASFNARPKRKTPQTDHQGNEIPPRVPYIIVVIDELADIMMTAKSEVETSLARIAQLSRAVGVHTILATQRPSVNVITGIIKANYPTRIAFQVTSQIDSRTILDGKGAEKLLGRGDMLFKPPGASQLERNQSPMVNDHEIEAVVDYVSSQSEQEFVADVFKGGADGEGGGPGEELSDEDEGLIERAIEIILQDRRATTSYVQRCLRIGYNRAALIMEILEQRGVVGPQIGSAPREILISQDESNRDGEDDETDYEFDN